MKKSLLLKCINALLVALMGLFGFTNCEMPVEYGTPEADYVVKGKVTNQADKMPIRNIRVGFNLPQFATMYGTVQPEYSEMPSVQTDENGNYILGINGFPRLYDAIDSLYVSDIDGAENGIFKDTVIAVDWKNAQQTQKGNNRWYSGEYTVSKDIELKKDE